MTLQVRPDMYRLPPEPPIGTVVRPDPDNGKRWVHRPSGGWILKHGGMIQFTLSWGMVLNEAKTAVIVEATPDAAADPLFSMRCYADTDIEDGYLWVKLAVGLDKPWRNWHGVARTDAEMEGSRRVPLSEVARAHHDDAR